MGFFTCRQKKERKGKAEAGGGIIHSQLSGMEKTVSIHPFPQNNLDMGMSSVIGTRASQQDAADIFVNEDGSTLAVLCDGMGGMENGELASSMSVKEMGNDFLSYEDRRFPEFLCKEIYCLDRKVANLKTPEGVPIKTGTTLVSVVVNGKKLYWGAVGDSRIYIIRGQEIVCVTTDHNYSLILREQIEAHKIIPEEAEQCPGKEALISYIGLGGLERVDINEMAFLLEAGDIIVLCSDGLYKAMDDMTIMRTVNLYKDNMSEAAEVLIKTASCFAGQRQDNTTVIIMKYRE